MVTTLVLYWFCTGLVRQSGFRTVVIGESRSFQGGLEWLRSAGIHIVDLDLPECVSLLTKYVEAHPEVWHEDIGVE